MAQETLRELQRIHQHVTAGRVSRLNRGQLAVARREVTKLRNMFDDFCGQSSTQIH